MSLHGNYPVVCFSLAAALASAAALGGCGSDSGGSGGTGTTSTSATSSTSGGGGAGGSGATSTSTSSSTSTSTGVGGGGLGLDTPAKINTYLEGKTLTMEGANIPSDPNGYNENYNFGSATQCYNKVTMTPTSGAWHIVSDLGTLNNAPNTGDMGMCDHTKASNQVSFDSTAILVENVGKDCFDFTATYSGFGQEGRGKFAADGSTISLELYFSGQAAGHRCADGAVGAQTVTIKGNAFKGNAVQIYTIK